MTIVDHDVFLSNDDGLEIPIRSGEIREAVCAVLDHEGVDRCCSVSVSIVDAADIRELNHEWRGIDAATDVLSFECDSPFDDEIPVDETVELGDVILCPSVICEQAPRFGNDPGQEFRLMLVHGLFHLLGYDHMAEDEALEMEAAELDVLRALASTRGEDPATVKIGPTTRHIDD